MNQTFTKGYTINKPTISRKISNFAAQSFFSNYQLMKITNIGVVIIIFALLLGLFFMRASQTKAYVNSKGKLPVVTEKDYTQQHLYKGRKPAVRTPKPAAAQDTLAVPNPNAQQPKRTGAGGK